MSIFQFPFIQNALVAGSLVALIAAVLGYFLILRGLTFAGHALSNIGFAGAAGAVLAGLHPIYGLLAFTLGAAATISLSGKGIRERDISTGVIMTFSLGLGVLFLSLYPGYAEQAYSILFGTIFGISQADVALIAALSALLILGLLFLGRPLFFSSFDPEVAEARGVPVKWIGVIFLLMIAITASVVMQVVGILLIFALLVGPPATAVRLANRPWQTLGLAVLLGLAYTWAGIILAAVTSWPVGFFITALSFGVYLPVRLAPPLWRKRA